MGRGWKNFDKYDRKILDGLKYAVSISRVINNSVSGDSQESEEYHEETVSSNMDM